jgi:hypothetical protein
MKNYVLIAVGVVWLIAAAVALLTRFSLGVYFPAGWRVPQWLAAFIMYTALALLLLGWTIPMGMGVRNMIGKR